MIKSCACACVIFTERSLPSHRVRMRFAIRFFWSGVASGTSASTVRSTTPARKATTSQICSNSRLLRRYAIPHPPHLDAELDLAQQPLLPSVEFRFVWRFTVLQVFEVALVGHSLVPKGDSPTSVSVSTFPLFRSRVVMVVMLRSSCTVTTKSFDMLTSSRPIFLPLLSLICMVLLVGNRSH